MMRTLVLDIETVLDRAAVERARRTGPAAFLRSWLHRVVAVSTLAFTSDPATYTFGDFSLQSSLGTAPDEEPALLEFVERELSMLREDDVLVTFNGAQHDLPVLAQRRIAQWLFEESALESFDESPHARHTDLMLELADERSQRWPALVDVCAALAIPNNASLRARQGPRIDPFVAKSQTDVVATYLLHCVLRSRHSKSEAYLIEGWTALADHILLEFPALPHLTQFATTPLALVARERTRLRRD